MKDTVEFTRRITPPDPIDGIHVKAGDTQRLPRDRAERWAAVGYGFIGKPEKPDKEVDFTLRFDEHQIWGQMNLKAGQMIKAPSMREARRMELAGHGSVGTELKPHVHDQAAIDQFNRDEAQRNHRPEFDERPGSQAIGRHPAFPRQRVEGWGV